MKLAIVVGTRPELIKLSRVIFEAEKYFDVTLIHTGQNFDYELNEVFFKDLRIRKPNYFLEAAGGSPSDTIASVISKSDKVFDEIKPDALLIYGDTNSCLCVIPAKKRRIPIFHLEAGNRCFDQRVPEEINRKIVDHLSDINMVHSEHARGYLLSEGLKPEQVIKTGSPMAEILGFYKNEIESSDVLKKLNVSNGEFFVVSAHREENVDSVENFENLLDSLNAIAEKYQYPIIVSTHPRTRKKLETMSVESHELITFMKPLGFFDYLKLQTSAKCVISDSGTITEEASILQFPAIMIRQAHERPEGMDLGGLILSGLKKKNVLASIEIACDTIIKDQIDAYDRDYYSKQVIKVIQSYTDYINRVVWRKDV
jgi:UDP-N-acetylglucosamine 2-epimerase (non-hydrolysing)